jgi:hypothetical protein
MQVTTIGLDIAKNVFQVHGIDAVSFLLHRGRVHRSSRNHVDSCSGGRANTCHAADHAKGICLPVLSNGLLRQEIVD